MSSQKLTVLKTQDLIKVISNSYESPYEIHQVLSVRRQCLRAITKASFKQVFTLYVSYFCDRFTAVPTAKQNTTPVIHVNWERHQTSLKSTLARGPRRLDLHCCLWLSSSLESLTDAVWFWTAWSSTLVCKSWPIGVFTLIHCCLCFHSSLYLNQAKLSCSFSATPCFIFAVQHIHSRRLPTPSRNLGLRLRLLGISVACFHQSFDPLVQADVFPTGFHANITSSSVSAETSQSWTVFITVEQAKPKRISWYYLKFCLCFLSHGSQNKSANQSLSADSKYNWITDLLILWCLVFPNFELFPFYQ